MRGRVMALYMAIFMGGTPLGAPLIGWIGARRGARAGPSWIGTVAVAIALVGADDLPLRSETIRPGAADELVTGGRGVDVGGPAATRFRRARCPRRCW